jgi:pyridoxal phosphate enzyme (YggS family)
MAAACVRAGRDPAAATLVAVSKTVPLVRLRLARAAGYEVFGENRVQEAASKVPGLVGARWHLVGHLQQNKAARAVALFDAIESVDSVALATRLDRIVATSGSRAGQRLAVYLQVNVDADPSKAGFTPSGLAATLEGILALPNLEVAGLMTVGLLTDGGEAARPTFSRLRALSEQLRAADHRLGPGLSMGMSDDYEIAIE